MKGIHSLAPKSVVKQKSATDGSMWALGAEEMPQT